MERCRVAWRVTAVAGVLVVSGCSAGDDALSDVDPVEQSVATTDAGELFTEVQGDDAGSDDDRAVESVTESIPPVADPLPPVTESLPPVAETGVPGIGSDDAFCRSWSVYAGSVQAISLAWALQPPQDAARLEVAATDALTDAVEGMANALPEEIESNRQALTVDVPGPFLRRAERANALLVDAGAEPEQIEELGNRWIIAITEQGVENENLSVDVPPDVQAALDAASETFADQLPSVSEDPTLDTTEFDIGPSLDYIAANCPDQATLAGNDVVDI